MRRTKKIQVLFAFAAASFLPVTLGADCNGSECVLIYRGAINQPISVSPDGTWVKELELADVDNDGWLDLLMLQKQPLVRWLGACCQIRPRNNLDVLYLSRGIEGLNFELDTPPDAFALKSDAFSSPFLTTRGYDAELADLDGDGNLDIIRADMPGLLNVLWGDGTGSFSVTDVFDEIGGDPNADCTIPILPPSINSGGKYDNISVGDCEQDGDPMDFIVAQYADCGENVVITNDGARNFSFTSIPALAAKETHSVSFGDANSDGNLDVLLDHGLQFDPEIYFGTSSNCTFESSSMHIFEDIKNSGGDRRPTTVGDIVELTGDDDPDIFFAKHTDGSDYGFYVNTGNPGAPYGDIFRIPECPGASGCPDADKYDVRYGDLDGDGLMEALTVNFNVSEVCKINAETGGWCEAPEPGGLPLGTSLIEDTAILVFRFDSNGFVDVTDEFVDSSLAGNVGGMAVAFGDLDLDGDEDVVLGGVVHQETQQPPDVHVFGAVHIYENRTLTRLTNHTIETGEERLLALDTLTAGSGAVISGAAEVTLEAGEKVVLEDGFTASPASGGRLVVRILP